MSGSCARGAPAKTRRTKATVRPKIQRAGTGRSFLTDSIGTSLWSGVKISATHCTALWLFGNKALRINQLFWETGADYVDFKEDGQHDGSVCSGSAGADWAWASA